MREAFEKYNVQAHVAGIGSLASVHFTKNPPRDVRTAQIERNLKLARVYFSYLLEAEILCLIL